MTRAARRRIAIIGAGWTGLACLRRLRDDGHEVVVFERYDDIGGVWHGAHHYVDLRTHSHGFTVEFPDLPLATDAARFSRLTAREVCDYLATYCAQHGLRPHLRTSCEVVRLDVDGATQQLDVTVRTARGEATERFDRFDYVINTAGWSSPRLPALPGQAAFGGELRHAAEAREAYVAELVAQRRRVVVLGGGKSATDLVLAFERLGHPVTWLYRRPYWFFNFSQQDRFLRGAMSARERLRYRWAMMTGLGLVGLLPERLARVGFGVLRRHGLIHTFGAPHDDFARFHHGRIDEAQMARLRAVRDQLEGEIAGFEDRAVVLTDGRRVAADVVLCATGVGAPGLPFPVAVDGAPVALGAAGVYRACVFPEAPRLVNTFYATFSFGMVNAVSRANWISRYIRADVSPAQVRAEATPLAPGYWEGVFAARRVFLKRIEEGVRDFVAHGELGRWRFRMFNLAQYFRTELVPLAFAAPDRPRRGARGGGTLARLGRGSAEIPFDMFARRAVGREADRARLLENLFHVAHRRAWDGRAVLADLLARHGSPALPSAERDALAQVLSVLLWGELGAWKISAQLADAFVPLAPKLAAASQVTDEARHFYVLHDYLEALGAPLPRLDRWSHQVLRATLRTSSVAQKILGMQLTIESLALTLFQTVRERELEPVLSALLPYFERDEARHVGLGVQVLPGLIQAMGLRERVGLAAFQLRLLVCAVLSLKQLEPALVRLGIDPRAVLTTALGKQRQVMRELRAHAPHLPDQAPLAPLIAALGELVFPREGDAVAAPAARVLRLVRVAAQSALALRGLAAPR